MAYLDHRALSDIRDNIPDYVWFSLSKKYDFKRYFKMAKLNRIVSVLCKAESYIDVRYKLDLKRDINLALENNSIQQLFTVIHEELQKPTITLGTLVGVLYIVRQIAEFYIVTEQDAKVDTLIGFVVIQLQVRIDNSRLDFCSAKPTTTQSYSTSAVSCAILGAVVAAGLYYFLR